MQRNIFQIYCQRMIDEEFKIIIKEIEKHILQLKGELKKNGIDKFC